MRTNRQMITRRLLIMPKNKTKNEIKPSFLFLCKSHSNSTKFQHKQRNQKGRKVPVLIFHRIDFFELLVINMRTFKNKTIESKFNTNKRGSKKVRTYKTKVFPLGKGRKKLHYRFDGSMMILNQLTYNSVIALYL